MKTVLKFVAILLSVCAGAHAQVVPEATGPVGLPVSGDLHYALRYAQSAGFYGSGLGTQQSSIVSADLDYAHTDTRLPFLANYGGGYIWDVSGTSNAAGLFQHLMISQGVLGKRWNATVSDNVSYTPESPTTGFSGIAGSGEPIGGSGSTPPSGPSILTLNTRTLSNIASGQYGYTMNFATSLSVGASSFLLYFPDGNGENTDGEQVSASLSRRLDARSSLSGQYMFVRDNYSGFDFATNMNTVLLGYQHTWNRQLRTTVSVGPEWIGNSNNSLEPPLTTVAVSAGANYIFRTETAMLSYNRGSSSGAGYLLGATVDSVNAGFSREFGRDLTVGLTASYQRTAGFQGGSGATDATYGGVQANRRFGRYLSVFANYTAVNQSSALSSTQTNVLNQLYQVIGFGVAYSPREKHLRQ
jgi:hypothetical protein